MQPQAKAQQRNVLSQTQHKDADEAAVVGESPLCDKQPGRAALVQSGASSITQEQVLLCRVRTRKIVDPGKLSLMVAHGSCFHASQQMAALASAARGKERPA